jgi:hypothetical protein
VDEASVTTRIEPAVAVADRPEPETRPEDLSAPYPYDQGEYATEGGHDDSADDAANTDDPDSNGDAPNADDPDSNGDVDLDTFDRDLGLVDERDPVR